MVLDRATWDFFKHPYNNNEYAE